MKEKSKSIKINFKGKEVEAIPFTDKELKKYDYSNVEEEFIQDMHYLRGHNHNTSKEYQMSLFVKELGYPVWINVYNYIDINNNNSQ